MENFELLQLKEEESKLVKKILDIKEKLTNKNKESEHPYSNSNLLLLQENEYDTNSKEEPLVKSNWKILGFSSRFLGISLEDCERKWLHDNTYKYKAFVKSKAINFDLDLLVKLGDKDDFKIRCITCHIIDLKKCFLNEVQSWIQKISEKNNLCLLFSAIYEYNKKNTVRLKVLNTVNREKYGNFEEAEDEKGGIIVNIHPPTNPNKIYVKLQWVLLFSEWSLQVVHFFIISSTEVGKDFVTANQSLLQDFCATNISKDALLQLWSNLFAAIDVYDTDQ